MTIKNLIGVNVNCQWPGFSSTVKTAASWSSRVDTLTDRIKAVKPRVILAQELGQNEAAHFFREMGSEWGYDRSGLNCVGWHRDSFDYVSTDILKLDSFGQMQRTAIAVKIKSKDGERFRLASSHLAVKANDLSAVRAILARAKQINQITSWINDDEDDWPTVIGMDANSRESDIAPGNPRGRLKKYGWDIDAKTLKIGNLENDAKRGIDLVATNYGAVLQSVDVFSLSSGSDHDARKFVLKTTKN